MQIKPITLKAANDFILKYHRHNLPVAGCKFAISAVNNNVIIGVAICGRPINRNLDNGLTLEIYRVCTNNYKNANSFLYSRCKRLSQLFGYEKIITYTLQTESSSSLKAINAKQTALFKGRQWKNHGDKIRKFQPVFSLSKIRWEL